MQADAGCLQLLAMCTAAARAPGPSRSCHAGLPSRQLKSNRDIISYAWKPKLLQG